MSNENSNIMRNKVQLIGHLGGTPEVKEFENNKVARVSIATNETYKTAKGEFRKETTWHNLVIWGKLAESAEKYFKKGSEVIIEGKIVNRTYEDKDGQKKYITEIKVDQFMMLGAKADS